MQVLDLEVWLKGLPSAFLGFFFSITIFWMWIHSVFLMKSPYITLSVYPSLYLVPSWFPSSQPDSFLKKPFTCIFNPSRHVKKEAILWRNDTKAQFYHYLLLLCTFCVNLISFACLEWRYWASSYQTISFQGTLTAFFVSHIFLWSDFYMSTLALDCKALHVCLAFHLMPQINPAVNPAIAMFILGNFDPSI